MNEVKTSKKFDIWLANLKDEMARMCIYGRIHNAREGNLGDCRSVGDGVFEMRIHYGGGYRLYYFQQGERIYYLLIGGQKNTQARDIEQAKALKRKHERGNTC
jgi:putative addiction module killer protein